MEQYCKISKFDKNKFHIIYTVMINIPFRTLYFMKLQLSTFRYEDSEDWTSIIKIFIYISNQLVEKKVNIECTQSLKHGQIWH